MLRAGKTIVWTATADITSGDVVNINDNRIAIADGVSIANGETGELSISGAYELTAKTADEVVQGQPVYWDDTEKKITTVDTFIWAGEALTGKGATVEGSVEVRID